MISIGYLDPGNWSTDLAAGSSFSYTLLFIILFSNIMATLLQYLCIKLGLVTSHDLAQSNKRYMNPHLNIFLYILCEGAIIATDLAEVVGTAIALKLLFGIPVTWGIMLTGLDVLVILAGWNKKYFQAFEYITGAVLVLVAVCFLVLLGSSDPDWSGVLRGFIPSSIIFTNTDALYIAMGIIGATVMPHNLFDLC